MDARASAKYLRGSAQKARLVVDMIRGKNVNEALAVLQYTNKRAADGIEKSLRSAGANAPEAACEGPMAGETASGRACGRRWRTRPKRRRRRTSPLTPTTCGSRRVSSTWGRRRIAAACAPRRRDAPTR